MTEPNAASPVRPVYRLELEDLNLVDHALVNPKEPVVTTPSDPTGRPATFSAGGPMCVYPRCQEGVS